MGDKSVLLSKTYGFNIAVALIVENSALASQWISAHPQTAFQLYAVANLVLRHFTKGKAVYALPTKPPVSSGGLELPVRDPVPDGLVDGGKSSGR